MKRLSQSRGVLWLLIYLVAVCITLLPAHLFEFRYFTPGAILALINMPPVRLRFRGRECVASSCPVLSGVYWLYFYFNIIVLRGIRKLRTNTPFVFDVFKCVSGDKDILRMVFYHERFYFSRPALHIFVQIIHLARRFHCEIYALNSHGFLMNHR